MYQRIICSSSRAACSSFNAASKCSALNYSTGKKEEVPVVNPKLHRSKDQHDITNMDLLEERIRQRGQSRELVIDGQTQKWNYRSELVQRHDLDKNHRRTWIAYFFIIIFGFGAFVTVKSQVDRAFSFGDMINNVVMGRKEEMEAREQIRKELRLSGVERKKIGIVDT